MSITARLFPRLHPSLPQNDSPAGRRQREKQLQQSCQTYLWTDTLPNVVGVPMAAEVPSADEPSQPWLLLVAETGLKLAENFLVVKLEGDRRKGLIDDASAVRKLAEVRARLASTLTWKAAHPDAAQTDLIHELASAAKHVALQHGDSFEELLADFRELVAEFEQGTTQGNTLADYEALFKTLPLPAIAGDFMDDASFARYRIAGPNPMLIRGVDALPPTLPLSDAQYRAVMGADDSLSAALAEHRVYLLDYRELDFLAAVPGETAGATKRVFAPIALFAIAKGGTRLVPVAIQCGQDPTKHPLFFPAAQGSALGWGWQMAKTVVQVAECNYHELFVHLARTHLVLEAFAVATHRCLAETHPINILLVPHCIGTLFINNAAAKSLISPGSPIDDFFGAPIARSQQAAGSDRLGFDFYANMLPADLAARGVDDPARLPEYPYRDDALLVWAAIKGWIQDYVGVYYADDAAVTGDGELADWAASLIADGKIKGFTPIGMRAQLVEVLTMVVFIATAQHSAVNFPQKPLMTYAPAITGAGWQDAPAAQDGHDEQQWLAMFPPTNLALEQLNVLYLLGSVHFRALGDYRSNHFPYLPWFEDHAIVKSGGPLQRFQQSLREVQASIEARNTERTPYPFLLPSGIPNSINI
ncbi:lipoxygenase family protein [Aquimonas sp.]|jgi:arachidonate 15-lipoxygenase|uniref:lipoxygenase family protein n=1 Tax=Aquimonas sp. TaxID=1872588 RepID=UPI0037C159C2